MAMTVLQAYEILSKFHGYSGPRTKRSMSQFINARDLPVALSNIDQGKLNLGGLVGMQEGGDTEKKEKPSGETVETETPGGDVTDMLYKGDLKRLVPVNEELTEAGKRKREEKFVRNPPNSAGVDNVENSKNKPTDFGVRQQKNTGTPR